MVALRVREFQGAVPRTDPEELGSINAQVALNCRLWNKKLKPWNGLLNISAVAAGVKAIFNLQGNWLVYQSDVDVVPSQLAGDMTGRVFYTGLDAPRTTSLSRAVIGNTTVNTPTSSTPALPHNFVNTTIAALGVNVGDMLNASVQITDSGAAIVNGRVQVQFLDVGSAVISTTDGSMLQGCGEYNVSLLKHLVVPAGTVSIIVKALADAAVAGHARFCYLTKGDYSASVLPVASVILGLAQPSKPPVAQIVPKVTVTGASDYSAPIKISSLTGATSPVIACDGTEVKCTGSVKFTQSCTAQTNGNVTVNLLRGGVIVDSQDVAFNCAGTATEPRSQSVKSNFTLTDTPPAANETYSLSVTTDFSGGGGAGAAIYAASGTIGYAGAIDLTCLGRTSSHAQVVGDMILDSNSNIQYCEVAGTTGSGGAPVWAPNFGVETIDGGVTWKNIGLLNNGTTILIAGVKGLTNANGNATVVSATGTTVRIGVQSQQVYTSGGTLQITFSSSFDRNNAEDRVYVYTYVANIDGQAMESQASVASDLITAEPQRPIKVSFPVTPGGDGITSINLYRTVADGSGGAVLMFVATFATSDGVQPADYIDCRNSVNLAGSLESSDWLPPPADMLGLVAMPNGVLVGFNSNTIIPSVPFQPQAYPEEYQLSTEYRIVNVKPFGQSLAVLTKGKPYVVVGPDPTQWIMEGIDTVQPCLAKRSAVDMGTGVLYACPDGIAMISTGGVMLISENFLTKDVWATLTPSSMIAARYQDSYICFYTGAGGGGFIFDPNDAAATFTFLNFQATAMWNDPATGELYLVVGNEIVQWDADGANPLTYTWQSRDAVMPKPTNMGRARVRASAYPVTLKVYADGALKATIAVADSNVVALPAGFLAKVWSFSVSGTAQVKEVILAESIDDIRQVEAA